MLDKEISDITSKAHTKKDITMGPLKNNGPATDLEKEFANCIQQRALCQDHIKSCHNSTIQKQAT